MTGVRPGLISGLTWLLVCQLAGELVVRLLGLPVPGAVLGMVILLALLCWRRPPETASVLRAADALLRHLQLFFVPAGVGLITFLALLREEAVPLLVATLVSWFVALALVGGLVTLLGRGEPAR
ncbi:CidA/LrgA family protein [Nocardioides limicola]|uniref:CidA/LrgA family protein n=1 Tax=Nocardioides limicola TaxID=2803368 RepID=UPI0027DB3143|nr:CidA/LrgA family protein [Nocardioides sp. DJM-14]